MKVLVTGSTGFVGSHLCDSLAASGDAAVHALVRTPEKSRVLPSNTQLISGDLSSSSIDQWVDQLPLDLTHFVHTAGIVHSFSKEEFFQINTNSTIYLFKKLKEKYSKLHFVFVSSLAAIGPSNPNRPHLEQDPVSPVSEYGKSKLAAEVFIKEQAPKNWKITILRPPMVIGPRDTAVLDVYKMVASKFVLATGMKGMEKLYSFVCVFDLVEIIKDSLTKQTSSYEIYFTAHENSATFKEIIDQIAKIMQKKTITLYIPFFVIRAISMIALVLHKLLRINIRLTPDKIHELEPMSWQCSGKKAVDQLGSQYHWNLERTIEVTFNDYRTRNWI